MEPSSWWFYFERIGKTVARCKENGCNWSIDQGPKKCTSSLNHHLKSKHPDKFKQYCEAVKKNKEKQQTILDSQPKLSFERKEKADSSQSDGSSQPVPVPPKRLRGAEITITQAFSK